MIVLEQFGSQPGVARRWTRFAFALVLGAAWCLTPACRSAFPRGALDPQTTNTAAGDGGWPTPPQPLTSDASDAGDASALQMPEAGERAAGDSAAQSSAAKNAAAQNSATAGLEPTPAPDHPAPRSDAPADLPADAEAKTGKQIVTPTPAPGAPETPLSDEAQIRELLERFYKDFATGEWTRMRQHFWPDATLVTIRSPGLGAPPAVVVMSIGDHISRHASGGGRGSTLRVELESRSIDSVGSIGSAIMHYRAIDTAGQEAQSWSGADFFSFVRHEGQWRIASLVFEGARFGNK
jgi:hypothetical protein